MDSEFRWMPEQASSFAPRVDAVYYFLLIFSGFFTALIAGLIVYFAIKYRRGSPADRRQGTGHFYAIELGWIVLPSLLTAVMFFWGAKIFLEQSRPPASAMTIDCVARQWMWKFQHPQGNAEINDLHVPLNQPVAIRMISEDVIHSFYVPAFRVKQDVLPGRYTTVWFQPTKVGRYHLFCAEYCGAKHAEMGGVVHVLEPAHYQQWLSEGEPASSPTGTGSLLVKLRCVSCHLPDQTPGRGPPLAGIFGQQVVLANGKTVTADETYLRESLLRPAAKIVAGYSALMPSFEGQLTEEQILQLIREIKALPAAARRAEEPPASSEQDGETKP
jgi:cytochrome c oxidase subunit 2